MKAKKILIFVLSLLCMVCFAAACGTKTDAEEIAVSKGYDVKVTLDLAGGTVASEPKRYLRIKSGTPVALPWEYSSIIPSPSNAGYTLVGWYTGTEDAEGNVTYGEEWDFSEKIYADMTLYAKWQKKFAFRIINALTGETVEDAQCEPGAKFDSSKEPTKSVTGYTFLKYYRDAQLTEEWAPDFTHPGLPDGKTDETALPDDYVYPVYAQYIEGVYKKVYKAGDFVAAANYYLIGDENGVIDCDGFTRWPAMMKFSGKIVGNGVTIKNLVCGKNNYSGFQGTDRTLGLFGRLEGASISDVKFENCTLDVTYTKKLKGDSAVSVGFLGGRAEDTALENVSFTNCAVNITVSVSEGLPVVTLEYDAEEELALWFNRGDDEANHNALTNVTGTARVTYKQENK